MGLYPQTIGTTMLNGFAGYFAAMPTMVVDTRPAGGSDPIPFGTPLKYDGNGNVIPMGAAATAAQFVGIAGHEIKSALTYLDQSQGQYAVGEPVSVFMRGAINVFCQRGTPALGGAVYLRITANGTYPSAVVGGLEAEADSSNTVQLTNCQWGGTADANGIVKLSILTQNNA